MNKAIFFDRDGVINKERGDYTWKDSDFEILPKIGEFMAEMKKRNYLLFIITNQGGIAKGLYTHEDYLKTELKISNYLKGLNIVLDAIYYCPHHPDITNCICRKPNSAMLDKAIARFTLDASKSYFIGDTDRDLKAAEKSGVNPIFLESNSAIFSIIDKIV